MVKYSCKLCGQEFSKKKHYDAHNMLKISCENNTDKIKKLENIPVKENLQKTGLQRETIDKFYTSQFVVKRCIEFVNKYINIHENDICIEPSAGNGSFINDIKIIFKNYRFYDLKPENDDFSPIEITEEMDFNIWGVVTYVVSKV